MTLLRTIAAAAILAAVTGGAPLASRPAAAESFSFQYNWSDGKSWGTPWRGRPDGWERSYQYRHKPRPRAPVVRDQFGRPLGYLVPGPFGPQVIERPHNRGRGHDHNRGHRGRGWGPPRGW